MGEPLAEFHDYDGLIRALRARKAALGLSDEVCEELGGLCRGHVPKLLGAARSKNLGPVSFAALAGVLGVKFAMFDDFDALAAIKSRHDRFRSKAGTPKAA